MNPSRQLPHSALLLFAVSLLTTSRLTAADSPAAPSGTFPLPTATTLAAPPADAPFKIHRTTPVIYPVSAARSGITHGEARVLINIDPEGKLADTLIAAYTHPPFGTAAVEAVRAWRYEPARRGGDTVGSVVDIAFRFEIDGILIIERNGIPDYPPAERSGAFIYKPQGLRTLDSIPTPLIVTQPIYPKKWDEDGIRGRVLVDFYIDEKGAVRMPAIVTADHPLLASAAITAVREWRFAPPLYKGKPVLAHCQQVFTFQIEPPSP